MKTKNYISIFLLLSLAYLFCSFGQEPYTVLGYLNYGKYKVGYQCNYLVDNSRSFTKEISYTGEKNTNTNRVIQYHIWYPAEISVKDTTMFYKDYVYASYSPLNKIELNNEIKQQIVTEYKSGMIERGADDNLMDKILSSKNKFYYKAKQIKEKFPLILYAPSINSNPYENSIMIEYLVSHGYVVVSSPCVGYHSLEVTRDIKGLQAQYEDLKFLLSNTWNNEQIDNTKIGTIGFSWGGMSNIMLSLNNYNIDAVVSIDGAISISDYINIIKSTPGYNVNNMTAAFLQFAPSDQSRNYEFYDMLKYSDATLVKIKTVKHKDFCSDGILKYVFGFNDPTINTSYYISFYQNMCELTLNFLNNNLRQIDKNYENDFIKEYCNIISKKKINPLPSEEEFIDIIRNKGVDEACTIFSKIKMEDSTAIFFKETSILNFATEWGPERVDDVIKLMDINLQTYPLSSESYFWLGQSYLAKNDQKKSLDYFRKCVELNPNSDKAKKFVEKLKDN